MGESGRGWARSSWIGGLVGTFAGGLTVFLLEGLGHALLGTVDPTDPSSITGTMFAAVFLAWIVGSAVAGAAATYWARSTTVTLGLIVGLILLAGAVSNMVVIPHPLWVNVGAVILMPLAAVLAARAVTNRAL
jgi:Na+/phosphate symporter